MNITTVVCGAESQMFDQRSRGAFRCVCTVEHHQAASFQTHHTPRAILGQVNWRGLDDGDEQMHLICRGCGIQRKVGGGKQRIDWSQHRGCLRRGWPNRVVGNLKRSISGYARHAEAFRIGITNSPEHRAYPYRREGWDRMIVLYTTPSSRNVEALETALLQHNWEREDLDNYQGYGGVGTNTEGPYYLYVVLYGDGTGKRG